MPTGRRVVFPASITSIKKTIETKKKQKKKQSKKKMLSIPSLFATQPPLLDGWQTDTSRSQTEVASRCLSFLRGEETALPLNRYAVQSLARELHVEFLLDALGEYPGRFVGLDASRPWMVYWALTGLALLGEDVTMFRERLVLLIIRMPTHTCAFMHVLIHFWQGGCNCWADAECGRGVWRRTWTDGSLCLLLCLDAQPGHGGRREGLWSR